MPSDGSTVFRALSAMLTCLACEGAGAGTNAPPEATGELQVALGVAGLDVTAIQIDVVDPARDCTGDAIASQTFQLWPGSSGEGSDAGGSEADESQRQGGGSFAVPAGDVRVCATPLAGEQPSQRCQPAEQVAHIVAGQTTEVRLVLQCRDVEDGILDAVIALNEAPRIAQLSLDPGDAASVCESIQLSALATDADGDALSYAWTVGDPRRLRPYEGSLVANGSEATFSATLAGSYQVNLVVDDGQGGQTELSVPLQIVDAACERD